jgi:beta-galactosidase
MADCRTGVKDETNLAHVRTLPGLLAPALGIEIEEYESLGLGITDKEVITYSIRTEPELGETYIALQYADWIKPLSAEPKARYEAPHLEDFAAVTRNKFGHGIGWYVGTIAQGDEFYDKLIAAEVAVRKSQDRELLFLISHADEEKTVAVPSGKRELISNQDTKDVLVLPAFDVAVIQLPGAQSQ